MRLKVVSTESLMKVMKEQGTREHQDIDKAIFDYISEESPHASRNQGSRSGDDDGGVVTKHVQPDAVRFRHLSASEPCALHLFK